jgi:hypothetical protein
MSSTAWSTANKVGFVLIAIAGAANLVPTPPGDNSHAGPPLSILIADAVLGVVMIVAVVHAWRKGTKAAVWLAAGAGILTALSSVPAFFVDGVPEFIKVIVAVYIVVTIAAIALALSPAKSPSA